MDFLCPACHTRAGSLVETVPVRALAAAWAEGTNHGEGRTASQINDWIVADLGTTEVRFNRCHACGLEVADPQRSWSSAHYPQTKHALGFDHAETLAFLAKSPPLGLLDIGCADGLFLEAANALGHHSVGIDFTRADIEAAQRRGLDAHVADVAELAATYSDGHKFDVVTLFQVIEHLNDPDEVFSQISAIASPTGRLFVGCPSDRRYTRRYDQPQRIKRSDFWDYPPQHTLRWNSAALEAFLDRHGWQVQKVVYEPFQIIGAAAHITQLHAASHAWPERSLRRRIEILKWLVHTTVDRFLSSVTGLRMLVQAQRRLNQSK